MDSYSKECLYHCQTILDAILKKENKQRHEWYLVSYHEGITLIYYPDFLKVICRFYTDFMCNSKKSITQEQLEFFSLLQRHYFKPDFEYDDFLKIDYDVVPCSQDGKLNYKTMIEWAQDTTSQDMLNQAILDEEIDKNTVWIDYAFLKLDKKIKLQSVLNNSNIFIVDENVFDNY